MCDFERGVDLTVEKRTVSQREYSCEKARDHLLRDGAGRGVRRFPGPGRAA